MVVSISPFPRGMMNGPSKFQSARKIRPLLEFTSPSPGFFVPGLKIARIAPANFSGCAFARAHIFIQVLVCLVFSEVVFFFANCSLLVRLTIINARALKEKRCTRTLVKTL